MLGFGSVVSELSRTWSCWSARCTWVYVQHAILLMCRIWCVFSSCAS